MPTAGRTSQPIGHAYFCQQLPQECAVRSKATSAPKLTKKRWNDLVEINNFSNNNVEPVTDQDLYGVEEHWTYPKSYGDCEDYVLLKRYMLLQRGWPESSLLITVVKQPNGDGHAVLTVRTDRADFVLDNLEGKVKQWDKTPYRYLKRQSTKHTGHWTTIIDRRNQVASY
ncbi:MAG: transglutaminase [Rhizobiaceae bacterium]|nr:transglutaminase [Rhizobiaceae bacterium]